MRHWKRFTAIPKSQVLCLSTTLDRSLYLARQESLQKMKPLQLFLVWSWGGCKQPFVDFLTRVSSIMFYQFFLFVLLQQIERFLAVREWEHSPWRQAPNALFKHALSFVSIESAAQGGWSTILTTGGLSSCIYMTSWMPIFADIRKLLWHPVESSNIIDSSTSTRQGLLLKEYWIQHPYKPKLPVEPCRTLKGWKVTS